MRLDLNALPTDIPLLHTLVRELVESLESERGRAEQLAHQLKNLQRRHFGRKSEHFNPDQLQLWLDALDEEQAAAELEKPPEVTSAAPKRRPPVRKPLPKHLPRINEVHDLDEPTCTGCGHALHRIGEDVTEQLDYQQASFFVHRTVRPKYACRQCETVTSAPLPPQPIDKGIPGPGLLAHVFISKYADHLPLYRQAQIMARHDIDMPRATLCGWVAQGASLLAPLVERMKADVLDTSKLHTDDTPVPVLEPGNGKTRQGRLWVYVRGGSFDVQGEPQPPVAAYQYTPTRNKDGPSRFLANYQGDLQADAYPGYDHLYATGKVREVACWAHARRKLYDIAVQGNAPTATEALAWIKRLYAIEAAIRDAPPAVKRQRRQEEAKPILDNFKPWLEAARRRLPPKSPLAKAIQYALARWIALTRYLDNGQLDIDNNRAERALRGVTLGRKNFLFAGSDKGGERAAIVYSLVETCKLNSVEPFAYLTDVFRRLPTQPAKDIDQLLPYNWQPATDTPKN